MIKKQELDAIIHSQKDAGLKIRELESIISQSVSTESKCLELKEKYTDTLLKQFSAFTFTEEGGYIIIGVTNDGKFIGISRDEKEDAIQNINDNSKNGKINIYSFYNNIRFDDIVKYHSYPLGDKFIFIIEIISGAAFIYKQSKIAPEIYQRNMVSSDPVSDGKEIFRMIIDKFQMGDIRNQIQKLFDIIVDIVRYYYIDCHKYSDQKYYTSITQITEFNKRRLEESNKDEKLKDILNRMNIEYRSTRLRIKENEKTLIYIPIQDPIKYDGIPSDPRGVSLEQYNCIIKNDVPNQIPIDKLQDVRSMFKEWAVSLTLSNNVPIQFDETKIPLEKDILIDILNDCFNPSKYNLKFFHRLCRISNLKCCNHDDKVWCIEQGEKKIYLDGNEIRVEVKNKDRTVIDEIIAKLKSQ